MKVEEMDRLINTSEKIHFVAWDLSSVWSQEDLMEELQYLYTKLYIDYKDKDIKNFIDFRYADVKALQKMKERYND